MHSHRLSQLKLTLRKIVIILMLFQLCLSTNFQPALLTIAGNSRAFSSQTNQPFVKRKYRFLYTPLEGNYPDTDRLIQQTFYHDGDFDVINLRQSMERPRLYQVLLSNGTVK